MNNSKDQKRINRHLATIHKQQHDLGTAKVYRRQASEFIKKLLDENRITKEELAVYFKRRS